MSKYEQIAKLLDLTTTEVSVIMEQSPEIKICLSVKKEWPSGKDIIESATIRVQDDPDDDFYGTNIDITKSIVNIIKSLR